MNNIDTRHINKLCNLYKISEYSIVEDGSINVYQDVSLGHLLLKELPIKFNYIEGNFFCRHNQLTTLKGGPVKVNGVFDCSFNYLTSLEYCPMEISGYMECGNNYIDNIEYFPSIVGGAIYMNDNCLYGSDFYNKLLKFMDNKNYGSTIGMYNKDTLKFMTSNPDDFENWFVRKNRIDIISDIINS